MFSTALAEEKRRLEGRLATMEEDLEEEQMNYESAVEKARKAQEQLDQMSGEVSQYQSSISKLENVKSQLEKQVSHVTSSLCNSCKQYSITLLAPEDH